VQTCPFGDIMERNKSHWIHQYKDRIVEECKKGNQEIIIQVARERGVKGVTILRNLRRIGIKSRDLGGGLERFASYNGKGERVEDYLRRHGIAVRPSLLREEAVEKEVIEGVTISIGGISKNTFTDFKTLKSGWEERLEREIDNDFFLQLLLAVAKLFR